MKRMIKLKEREGMLKKLEDWKRQYSELEVPKNIKSKKKRNEWVNEVYLAQEEGEVVISGGGRILLWLALMKMNHPLPGINRSWEEYISYLERKGRVNDLLEVLKFRHREQLLGTNLIQIPGKNVEELINAKV